MFHFVLNAHFFNPFDPFVMHIYKLFQREFTCITKTSITINFFFFWLALYVQFILLKEIRKLTDFCWMVNRVNEFEVNNP